MINVAAVIFQFRKLMFLIITSTTALRGIPRIVPIDMKRGKVNAIPKLMRKLKAKEVKAEIHNGNHGMYWNLSSSTPVKCSVITISQKVSRLNNPRKLRKRDI